MLTYSTVDAASIPLIKPYFDFQQSRNCDYTMGVIYMWRSYFHTEYAIESDTLYLRMRDEQGRVFHLLPIGKEPPVLSLKRLCPGCDCAMRFSAVTEDQLMHLRAAFGEPDELIEERRWADYLYEKEKLSTYAGKKLAGQRNHVNRFLKENEGFIYEPVTAENIGEARAFLLEHRDIQSKDDPVAFREYDYTLDTLDHFSALGYTGALLKLPSGKCVGISFGETVGDTLFVHVEKALRNVHGSGQLLCREFAAHAPEHIKYINREDDMGDEGLRYAKMSLHPAFLLMKHTVIYRIK
ncbi:MAG: DUF2156 domain-containing protein [Clostridia bacterium]|nr:DUF2156 domain-containing protein [Clostridia bacterium]